MKLITAILFLIFTLHQLQSTPYDAALLSTRFMADPPDTTKMRMIKFSDFVEEEDFGEEEDMACEEESSEESSFMLAGFPMDFWDTQKVNPFNMDFKSFKDTCYIKLVYDGECDYAHPINGVVTSEFGFRRTRYHYGIDVDLETGDPVVAAFEGLVRISKYSPSYGYYVVIRHKNGLETLYAHLSELKVPVGAYVQAGEVIGLGGNTGKSRGSHLHFEVRYMGQQINPREIIDFNERTYVAADFMLTPKHFEYLKNTYGGGAAGTARYYKVKKGDTLSKIASRNRTTVARLCKLNKIKPTTVLQPGKTLRIG